MKLDLICHIGLHKTASGTLQRQFFPACVNLNLVTTQQKLASNFIHAVTRQDPLYFDGPAARTLLLPQLASDRPNLISNESLSGPPYAGLIEYGLDHRSPALDNLRSAFPEARILIVLRRQDSLARSLYRQYLKRGGTAKIDRFYGMAKGGNAGLMPLDRFRYFSFLKYLSKRFPAGMKVMLFEDFLANRNAFLSDMCGFIGIQCPDINLKVENATRLGPIGMEVSRLVNFAFRSMVNNGPLPKVPRKQFGRWRFVSPVEYLHDYWPGGGGRPSKLVKVVCNKILEQVATDNKLVDEQFNLGLSVRAYY